MSLREEISEIILNGNYKECEEYKMTSYELAGLIVSKIEKRIDELCNKLNPQDKDYDEEVDGCVSWVQEEIRKILK